jgi:RNA polymerase sigma-70 factor (ECF subfamily)
MPALNAEQQSTLVQAVARGERRAFEELYAMFFRPLSGYLLRMVRDSGLVEELVDDTFFEAWKHAARFRGDSKLSTWLFGIARNRALNALRARKPAHDELDEAVVAFADSAQAPDRQASQRQTAQALASALAGLPPDQREALELVLHQGLSYEEAAQVLRAPLNTVKTRVFHARRKLREALADLQPEGVDAR